MRSAIKELERYLCPIPGLNDTLVRDLLFETLKKADEFIIFGSFACGVAGPKSDLDILVVGEGERIKTPKLDMMFIDTKALGQRRWLGSELACHISEYGEWVKGSGKWRANVHLSETAVERKRERLIGNISLLYLKQNRWSEYYLLDLLRRVVLDISRLRMLSCGQAVPARQKIMIQAIADMFDDVRSLERLMGRPVAHLISSCLGCHVAELPSVFCKNLLPAWTDELASDFRWRQSLGLD